MKPPSDLDMHAAQGRRPETGLRRHYVDIVALVLFLASLGFFYQCVVFLGQRDYVAAVILMFVGFAVIRVGAELARVSLARRD